MAHRIGKTIKEENSKWLKIKIRALIFAFEKLMAEAIKLLKDFYKID